MSWLDALLGRIQSGGSELELQGAINFTDGVEATANPNEGRIDVRATPAVLALLPLASALRIAGVTIIEGTGSTVLSDAAFTTIAGAFTGSAKSDSTLTASANQAAVTYSGTAAARVLVIASGGSQCTDANSLTLGLYVGAVASGGVQSLDIAAGTYSGFCTCGLVTVAPGDVISLRATTDTNGVEWGNIGFSMIAIVVQDSVA
jgi:hypothetical protein